MDDRDGIMYYIGQPPGRCNEDMGELSTPQWSQFWWRAWHMALKYVRAADGRKIGSSELGLAINSQSKRSQDFLHIHLGCFGAKNCATVIAAEAGRAGPSSWLPITPKLIKGDDKSRSADITNVRVTHIERSMDGTNPFAKLGSNLGCSDHTCVTAAALHTLVVMADDKDGFNIIDGEGRGEDLLDYSSSRQ